MNYMICRRCLASWPLDSIEREIAMFYFRSSSGQLAKPTSLHEIDAAGLELAGCPKDPLPLDPSMGAPDLSTGLQPDRSPDSGERPPSPEED